VTDGPLEFDFDRYRIPQSVLRDVVDLDDLCPSVSRLLIIAIEVDLKVRAADDGLGERLDQRPDVLGR